MDDLEQDGVGGVNWSGADLNLFVRSGERVGLPSSDVMVVLVAGDNKGPHEADSPKTEDLDDWQRFRQRRRRCLKKHMVCYVYGDVCASGQQQLRLRWEVCYTGVSVSPECARRT